MLFVSDYFFEDITGGGEICDHCIISHLLHNKKIKIQKIHSKDLTVQIIKNFNNETFIISNFVFLSEEVKQCFIYEHDYKFLHSRNPANFIDFKVPKQHIINQDFYKSAKMIICQSNFQKNIFIKNLEIENIISIGTNFWLPNHFSKMQDLSSIKKNDIYAILASNVKHKNTDLSIQYCKRQNIQYNLIPFLAYEQFLNILANFKGFIFFPGSPETFSRTILESRMMNLEIITNELIGCRKEDWYPLYKGKELIEYTKSKNNEAYRIFEELI